MLPLATEVYREIGDALGEPLLFPMRVRRFFRNDRERDVATEKHARGDLTPFVTEIDSTGFWIELAQYLDTRKVVERLRDRWAGMGRLTVLSDAEEIATITSEEGITIRCVGATELTYSSFGFAGLQAAKGQLLRISCAQLEPGVILNDGHWVLPTGPGQARVGATYEPGCSIATPTLPARATLEQAAQRLLRREFSVIEIEAGIRVSTPDKHPIVGRDPKNFRVGVINGLGSKGGLWAPWLARQWIAHLRDGTSFDPAVDVQRFIHR